MRNSEIAIASRCSDQHREEGRVCGAVDEVEGAEISLHRVPRARRQESEAELGERELRLPNQLIDEEADDGEDPERRGAGDDVEQAVADAVAEPAAAERDASRVSRPRMRSPGPP